jgi:hypothetical protein
VDETYRATLNGKASQWRELDAKHLAANAAWKDAHLLFMEASHDLAKSLEHPT